MAEQHTHAPESKGDHGHAAEAHSHGSDAHGHGGNYLHHIRPYLLVGAALFLSPKTVRNYISTILDKLQLADRAEAIVRAREAGMG